MPIPLSSVAIEEKNKLAADSVFLVALKIEIPGLEEIIRVVRNTEDITWKGETWTAVGFDMEEIKSDSKGEVPRVDIRVSNVDRSLEYYVHEYETWCKANYREPITCTIYVVNSLNLASDTPEAEHVFELVQPKANAKEMTFTLGASNPFNRRYPKGRLLPTCQRWRFKDDRCAYAGSETVCDKTLARCRELSNTDRFDGFYAVWRP